MSEQTPEFIDKAPDFVITNEIKESTQTPQIIDHIPGMPPVESAEPNRDPIQIENPGPQTLRTAIGTPYRQELGPNVLNGPVVPAQEVGDTAVNSTVEVVSPKD
jgi:hypothetical protein